MKKFLYITMVLVISLSFVACGSKTTTDASKTSKDTTPVAATTPAKITYTKDLAYLPTYNGVKTTNYTAKTKKALATSKYTLKSTTDVKVFNDYQAILKQDGWTITEAKKSYSLIAKKGTHMAIILIQKTNKDVILSIMSK
ncbi:hypothetical protein [Clostridium estertheticum]|uniref:DUF4358 domain-containing protein n=1 Tax=Clostridium estertheticum subsp. estertheticum TaxID=1552 RepID=A0A1J0GKK2_9CLOT|nr:hypothetical protein [Clostridium estertheticum]APC41900.1 hypothetical protein A7L45_18440 [Clostridium estertheticum subsp. estertheticum]MBU3073245.1 hypothetical protein [Clostridium estertheticum]MBU3163514.1 hypothetical protein [Clostridium estertheticum]MBZ9616194.1 hypothetical protein [Clostridium estertheticum subsp. laramiense]WAG71939.1 hypothetical protein LL032_12120 [Clostridium estertheticum]